MWTLFESPISSSFLSNELFLILLNWEMLHWDIFRGRSKNIKKNNLSTEYCIFKKNIYLCVFVWIQPMTPFEHA